MTMFCSIRNGTGHVCRRLQQFSASRFQGGSPIDASYRHSDSASFLIIRGLTTNPKDCCWNHKASYNDPVHYPLGFYDHGTPIRISRLSMILRKVG